MGTALRQSELFAGNDWQVLYRAFTEVNFNASDPPSINAALRAYLQQTYPENFNDWIESSEFVALIDLLSWLAGTLAFKTDLNAREGFLETAEARESILRLARFISYNPRRNQCAQGLVKLVEVMTDDDVMDGFGTNLNNVPIQWDNPDDPDWFERFVLVMNSAFISTNQFGVPLKTGTVASAKTQQYRLNNVMSDTKWGFSTSVGSQSMDFELINSDFDDGGGFYERDPDLNAAFNLCYRNDGNGNSSPQTGFFILFKQGTLNNTLFNLTVPVENTVLPISVNNVNDTDVWVQTTTDAGSILINWNKVPAIFNENITYNNFDPTIRNIFSVITQDSDQIAVRFSDGRFGSVPTGNIRIFYRVSNGLQYQIRPSDMSRIKTTIPYYNRAGVKKNLTVTFSLQSAVANSTPRETDAQIKSRAPSVYATQNRMVSGEDYNTFPLQSNLATKLKAINRVYSGHSRYIDLNDPTGNYQDVNVFSDDGIFFKQVHNIYTEIPMTLNPSASDIVTLFMQPLIERQEVLNLTNDYLLTQAQAGDGITWTRASTDASFSSSGYFSNTNTYLVSGATLKFQTNTGVEWATIAAVNGPVTEVPPTGTAGPVTLSLSVPTGSTVLEIIPPFDTALDSTISTALQTVINNNQSFTLWYDYSVTSGSTPWLISPPSTTGTQFLVMDVNYMSGGLWSLNADGASYVFESLQSVQWYDDGRRTTDEASGIAQQDLVRVSKVNPDLNNGGLALGRNYDLYIDKIYVNRDGSANPRRTTVVLADANLNGAADDPDTFSQIIDDSPSAAYLTYLFWQHDDTYGDVPMPNVVHLYEQESDRVAATPAVGTVAFQINGASAPTNDTFWLMTSGGWVIQRAGTYSYGIGRGSNTAAIWYPHSGSPVTITAPDNVIFQWKHYAATDVRIDPARTNINDIFVLTSDYDYQTRLWIANGSDPENIPEPPTELDLRLAFEEFEDFRMFSDQIVWRPSKYKFLFGNGANDQLRATIKVVQLPTSTLSAGEVQSQVIRAINTYFSAQYWDFGETFYFTPLAAYIHEQLAVDVASVVLVPTFSDAYFGDGFEIRCRSDEIFISTAQVADVQIISSNTSSALRIR